MPRILAPSFPASSGRDARKSVVTGHTDSVVTRVPHGACAARQQTDADDLFREQSFPHTEVVTAAAARVTPVPPFGEARVAPLVVRARRPALPAPAQDLYILLPQIRQEEVLVDDGTAYASTGVLSTSAGLPAASRRGTGWTVAPGMAPFAEVVDNTAVLAVSGRRQHDTHEVPRDSTAQTDMRPLSWDRAQPMDLFAQVARAVRPGQRAWALLPSSPPPAPAAPSRLRFSGVWEALRLPGALTADGHTFLVNSLAPLMRGEWGVHSAQNNAAVSSPERGAAGYPDGHDDDDDDDGEAALGAALSTGARLAETRARGGSLKRTRSDAHDVDVDDDVDDDDINRTLDQDAALLQVLGQRRVVVFETQAWPSPSPSSARFLPRGSASLVGHNCGSRRGCLTFTLQAHLLSARLPMSATRTLLSTLYTAIDASLSSSMEQEVGMVVVVPFWVACFAHTHTVHASVTTHLLGHPSTASVRWPDWVPGLGPSLAMLNGLQAAAWVVVRDLLAALEAESRVCALDARDAMDGDDVSGRASVSSAVRSLTHLTEAVLSPARQSAVLATFQAHLPFPVSRGDLLRYPPPPPPPTSPSHVACATAGGSGLRDGGRGVAWPAVCETGPLPGEEKEATAHARIPHALPTASTPQPQPQPQPQQQQQQQPVHSGACVFPSLLEVIHDTALRLLARYFPHAGAQLQGLLSARLPCALPPLDDEAAGRAEEDLCTDLVYGEVTACLATTVARLQLWQCFWASGPPGHTPRAPRPARGGPLGSGDWPAQMDALQLSMTVSQWSLRSFQWLLTTSTPRPSPTFSLLGAAEHATGSSCLATDGATLALFLAVLPVLCRVYLNPPEVASVLQRGLQGLVSVPACAGMADKAFRFLLAVLIYAASSAAAVSSPPTHVPTRRASAFVTSAVRLPVVSEARFGVCWSLWITPLRHVLASSTVVVPTNEEEEQQQPHLRQTRQREGITEGGESLLEALLGRLERALQWLRAALHAHSSTRVLPNPASPTTQHHPHRQQQQQRAVMRNEEEEEAHDRDSTIEASSSVFFASAAASSLAGAGGSVWSGLTESSVATGAAAAADGVRACHSACTVPSWWAFIHRRDVRQLRAMLQCVRGRCANAVAVGSAEVSAVAPADTGSSTDGHSGDDGQEGEEEEEEFFFAMPAHTRTRMEGMAESGTDGPRDVVVVGDRETHSSASSRISSPVMHNSYSSAEEETLAGEPLCGASVYH